jgi:hypothetical protein
MRMKNDLKKYLYQSKNENGRRSKEVDRRPLSAALKEGSNTKVVGPGGRHSRQSTKRRHEALPPLQKISAALP